MLDACGDAAMDEVFAGLASLCGEGGSAAPPGDVKNKGEAFPAGLLTSSKRLLDPRDALDRAEK